MIWSFSTTPVGAYELNLSCEPRGTRPRSSAGRVNLSLARACQKARESRAEKSVCEARPGARLRRENRLDALYQQNPQTLCRRRTVRSREAGGDALVDLSRGVSAANP